MKYSFIRFLLVGIVNTSVGMGLMYLLIHIAGFGYWAATAIGIAVGSCVSYMLNRTFTFGSKKQHASSIVRFILVILVCYFVAYFLGEKIVHLFLKQLDVRREWLIDDLAVLFGTGIYTIFNYFGQRNFVFHTKEAN